MLKTIHTYSQSLRFLFQHKLGWFLWFPLIITVLVFFGGFSLTSWATKIIADTIDVWIKDAAWMPDWADVIQDLIYWLIWIGLRIVLYFAFAFFGGTVILLLMAPVLTYLSERTAAILGIEVPPFSLTQFTRDLTRAAALAIRNGLLQILLSAACFLIGFIPLVGLASTVFIVLINAYFYGYNFLDYSMERKRFSVRESNRFVWKHRANTVSIGMPFALWMLVPFIGHMSAGFVAIFATIAATMEHTRLDEQSKLV